MTLKKAKTEFLMCFHAEGTQDEKNESPLFPGITKAGEAKTREKAKEIAGKITRQKSYFYRHRDPVFKRTIVRKSQGITKKPRLISREIFLPNSFCSASINF